jgi:hypothetical protein
LSKATLTILVCALVILISVVRGRCEAPANFDSTKAMTIVRALADDAMKGRKSGLSSGERAARFVADAFRDWELEPAGEKGTCFQPFTVDDLFVVQKASLDIAAGGRTRICEHRNGLFDDWRVCDNSGSGTVRAEIVLVGFGVRVPNGYDDIVNFRPMPFAEAAPKLKDTANPDVDFQLATVTIPGRATLAEARVAVAFPQPVAMLVQLLTHADQRFAAAGDAAQQQTFHFAAHRRHGTDKGRATDRAVAILAPVLEQPAGHPAQAARLSSPTRRALLAGFGTSAFAPVRLATVSRSTSNSRAIRQFGHPFSGNASIA